MVSKVASAGITALKWGVCTLAPLGLDRFLHRLQVVKALDKKNPLLSRVITIFAPSALLLHFVNHSSWKTTLAVSSVLTAFAALRSSSPNGTTRNPDERSVRRNSKKSEESSPIMKDVLQTKRNPDENRQTPENGKPAERPLARSVGASYLQMKGLAFDPFVRFRDLSKENKKLAIQWFYKDIEASLENQAVPLRIQSLRKCGPLFIKKVIGAITISDGPPNRGGMRITIKSDGSCNFARGQNAASLEFMKDSDPRRAICEAHLELVMDQIEWIHAALRSNDEIADLMVQSLSRHFDLTCRDQRDNTFNVGKLYNNACFSHDTYFEEIVTVTENQRKILFFMHEPNGGYVFEIIQMPDRTFQIKVANNNMQEPISFTLHKISNTHHLSIESSKDDISLPKYLENPEICIKDLTHENQAHVIEDLALILHLLQIIHGLETSPHTLVIKESGQLQDLSGEQVPYERLRRIAGYTNGYPRNTYLGLVNDQVILGNQIIDRY